MTDNESLEQQAAAWVPPWARTPAPAEESKGTFLTDSVEEGHLLNPEADVVPAGEPDSQAASPAEAEQEPLDCGPEDLAGPLDDMDGPEALEASAVESADADAASVPEPESVTATPELECVAATPEPASAVESPEPASAVEPSKSEGAVESPESASAVATLEAEGAAETAEFESAARTPEFEGAAEDEAAGSAETFEATTAEVREAVSEAAAAAEVHEAEEAADVLAGADESAVVAEQAQAPAGDLDGDAEPVRTVAAAAEAVVEVPAPEPQAVQTQAVETQAVETQAVETQAIEELAEALAASPATAPVAAFDVDAPDDSGEAAVAVAASKLAAPPPGLSEDELVPALEAIMLVVDEPVSEITLAEVLDVPAETIAGTLIDLSARYTRESRGFDLRRAAGGWRLYTRAEYAPYVERFVLDGQQLRLTQASLETLAVVAYKQPVTRSRISAIRGVNCDGVIRTLVTRGMIEECGTEPESGAYLYRTTSLFLEKLGLDSVGQLPPLAPFLPDNVEEIADEQR